jgi:hypothetical protein
VGPLLNTRWFDGAQLQVLASAAFDAGGAYSEKLAAGGRNDVYSVGYVSSRRELAHWTGTWQLVPGLPQPPVAASDIVVHGNDVWISGAYYLSRWSPDGGWTRFDAGTTIFRGMVSAAPDALMIASSNGVYRFDGGTFALESPGSAYGLFGTSLSDFWATTFDALLHRDATGTWSAVPIPVAFTPSRGVSVRDGGVFVVGSSSSVIYRP